MRKAFHVRPMNFGGNATYPLSWAGVNRCFAPIKATEEADVPPFPACVLFGSHWLLPSGLNTPLMLTRTPHGADLDRDPPHTLGRGTLLTCGDVEENPGPKGGKPGRARRARRRGNSPPEPAALQEDGTNEEEVDDGHDLLNYPAV